MKKIIIIGVAVLVAVGLVYAIITQPTTIESDKKTDLIQNTATTTSQIELDKISEAQKQLDATKKLLDEEEKANLAKIAEIEARAKAEITVIEADLEEIRKVRLSFSQAPEQAQ